MIVLGINHCLENDSHDSSAALSIDGNIVSFFEEERLNKIKHSPNKFPILSIQECLKQSNITFNQIDEINTCLDSFELINSNQQQTREKIQNTLKKYGLLSNIIKINHIDHHIGHLLNSYYLSGFDNAIGLVIDAIGSNDVSISVWYIDNFQIQKILSFPYKYSLGLLYLSASEYLGLGNFSEGKLMGLSSFGNDLGLRFLSFKNGKMECIYNNLYYKANTIFELIELYKKLFSSLLYPYQKNISNDTIIYYSNIAKTIQENYNDVILNIISYAAKLTKSSNLVLSGGCIQNCIGNSIICKSNMFKNIYASFVPHDAGNSLGYCYYSIRQHINNKETDKNIIINNFNTKTYQISDISKDLLDKVIISEVTTNQIALDLKNNFIICWYQYGSEYGPRALGHRSILANPSIRDNLIVINKYIKHREIWRPLAPIILDDHFNDIFHEDSQLSEYMLRTYIIDAKYRKMFQAVCHIDSSTRPQIIKEKNNKELYKLLKLFYSKTGIPGLLNTSLNDNGKPICETPDDLIIFLLNTPNVKYAIFNNKYKIERRLI